MGVNAIKKAIIMARTGHDEKRNAKKGHRRGSRGLKERKGWMS